MGHDQRIRRRASLVTRSVGFRAPSSVPAVFEMLFVCCILCYPPSPFPSGFYSRTGFSLTKYLHRENLLLSKRDCVNRFWSCGKFILAQGTYGGYSCWYRLVSSIHRFPGQCIAEQLPWWFDHGHRQATARLVRILVFFTRPTSYHRTT